MKRYQLILATILALAVSGVTLNGITRHQKRFERSVEYKQKIQIWDEAYRKSIDELYKNPNSETVQAAKIAATNNLLHIHLYRNKWHSRLPADTIDAALEEYISNTTRCLEGLELLPEEHNLAKYVCASTLERQRTLATLALHGHSCSSAFIERIWDEIEITYNDRRDNPMEVDGELYRRRQMVQHYANIAHMIDPNIPKQNIGTVADRLVIDTYSHIMPK